MKFVITLTMQTGMVIGIMVCVTGAAIGAVKLAEMAGRLLGGKWE